MKKYLLAFCTFFYLLANAQLDTEHWFAPMAAKADVNQLQGFLYLSTDEATPFPVQVFNNNTLYTTVQVSKNNPIEVSIPNNFLIATTQSQLFTPNSMGLNVKGTKKFFANYRFSLKNQAEILTSKGAAGLGTTFYAGMAPIAGSATYMNSTIGVTATANNTTVEISGYDPTLLFSNGTTSLTKKFTLNKGQSYILDVVSSQKTINKTGLIGAKITASNPITVTNGNFNGAYVNVTNNDVLMDQSVPVDRLGKNFVMVKGNGGLTSQMESAVIVATENNTQITFNGTGTPVVLNAGKYYLVPSNKYIHQGNGHYNMNISATKNVYVYQLLSGATSGNEFASGGMNFIPPVSCFMPTKIEEIGFINKIGNDTFTTRLNIITQKGATVTVGGNSIAAGNGPYPVAGNPDWETYSILGVSGNITVNSNKPVTAGIAAGNGAVGYGGYFAGFSSVPVITKTGDCYNGVLLQVESGYDDYKWYHNGVEIPGATTFTLNPNPTGSGIYTCKITKNNCETRLTAEYDYTVCPPITTTTYDIGSCNTQVITPAFTSSAQTIDPAHTNIIVQPTKGTVAIHPTTGQITYTPNPGMTADTIDTFTYYIQGNGNPAAFEYFTIVVNTHILVVTNDVMSSCPAANGDGTYNLKVANVTSTPGATVTYFTNANLTGPIANPANYTGPAGVVYANVTSYGCSKIGTITLNTFPTPVINTTNFNANSCSNESDGNVHIDFNNVTPQIVANSALFTVTYYLNQADAINGNSNTLPSNWSYSANTIVYVRATGNVGGCPAVLGQINFTVGNKVSLITNNANADVCDNDLNGSENVNLNDYKGLFTVDPNVILSFHTSATDAQTGNNPISATQILTSSGGVYHVRFQSTTACANTGILTLTLKTPKKSNTLHDQIVCSNDKILLDAGTGFTSYLWSNGATTQTITASVGNYYVDLGFNGCVYRQHVKVATAQAPIISKIDVSGTTATVYVTGGTPPYRYSLNGIDYQSSNVFTGLSRGTHTVYVLASDGCRHVTKEFLVINLINTITPNGDGINDILNYSELRIKQNVSIEVSDRYGNSVYKSSDKNYIWDGKSNGRNLPTGTYWYVIKWIEPDTQLQVSHSGWLLIKNRE
ncbi:gliding motility-associated C-terminal domain-containing protein [Chryseobacterium tructae]|uniref:Gliding motility-associated C-terminal domain-containing protein n=1 Tax=Chryseobacterium tructae TaxID=1037380 RepID=A0ABV7XRU6_9FLAO